MVEEAESEGRGWNGAREHAMAEEVAVSGGNTGERGGQRIPREGGRGGLVALIVLLAAVFMDMIDAQIVSIALPSIQREMSMDPAALQWTAAGYTLAYALTLITGGRLGDRYGHKRAFIVAIAGFTIMSLAAGMAPTAGTLIAARLAQGVFAGLMVPQVLSYIQIEIPADLRPKAMGMYAMTFPLGGMAAPVLGGLLTQGNLFGLGWRTIFLVNLPIGLFATIAAIVLIRPRPAGTTSPRLGIDVIGWSLLTITLVALLFPLIQGRELGWPAWSIIMLTASAPLLLAFIAHQRRRTTAGKEPLVRTTPFRRRSASIGLVVMLTMLIGPTLFFVLALYFQNGLRFTPLVTGLTFLAAGVGIIVGNGLGMSLIRRIGARLVTIAALVAGASAALLATVITIFGSAVQPWQLAIPTLVFGCGFGLATSSLMSTVMSEVEPADAGSMSGVVNTAMQVSAAIGPALLGTVFFTRLGGTPAFADQLAATQVTTLVVIALFTLAFVLSLFLPRTKT